MSFVAVAVAGIGAAGAIGGGAMAKAGANAQADAASRAAADANALQSRMFDTTRQDQAPWLAAGSGAVNSLANLLGIDTAGPAAQFQENTTAAVRNQLSAMTPDQALQYAKSAADPNVSASREQTLDWVAKGIPFEVVKGVAVRSGNAPTAAGPTGTQAPGFGSLLKDFSTADFQTDPGYEFRLSEGQKAIDRSAAAHGSLFSGATLKANDAYNQNFASNEFSNAYNRFQSNRQTKYNMIAGISGAGQGAANTVANAGTQSGNSMANTLYNGGINAAQARASGYAAMAGGVNGAINNLLPLLNRAGASPQWVPTSTGGTPPFVGNAPNYWDVSPTPPVSALSLT